jgi:hypothetical protein
MTKSLIERVMEKCEFKGVRHPLSHPCAQECSGHKQGFDEGSYAMNVRLTPILRELCAIIEEADKTLETICVEIHDEHCDEDWHCNWCEQILIARTEIAERLKKIGEE